MNTFQTDSEIPCIKRLKQIKDVVLPHLRKDKDQDIWQHECDVLTESNRDSYEFLMEIPSANILLIKENINAKLLSQASNVVISFWDSRNFEKIDSVGLEGYSAFIHIEKAKCLVASTGYGTLIIFSLMKPIELKIQKKIKAYRGSLTQLIEIKNTMWLASFGYDAGASGEYSIKIWDLSTFKRVAKIKTRAESESNIVYIQDRQGFAVLNGYEIDIICYKKKQTVYKIDIEIYGKKIYKQLYVKSLNLLVIIIESSKDGQFERHSMMAWRMAKEGPAHISVDIKCLNPLFIEEENCVIGVVEKSVLAQFLWKERGGHVFTDKIVESFPNAGYLLSKISNRRLLQIVRKRLIVWEY